MARRERFGFRSVLDNIWMGANKSAYGHLQKCPAENATLALHAFNTPECTNKYILCDEINAKFLLS
jgi:hypothetical protein